MIRLRTLYNDLFLLRFQYKRARRDHPEWRRLELVRAGLEGLGKWQFHYTDRKLYALHNGKLLTHNGDTWVEVDQPIMHPGVD